MSDHVHLPLALLRNPDTSKSARPAFYRSKELQENARKQWDESRTGPLTEYGCTLGLAIGKSKSVSKSEEFAALPEAARLYLGKEETPEFEVMLNTPYMGHFFAPAAAVPVAPFIIMLTHPQSIGSAKMQSSDPAVPLAFDPNIFSCPYDRRVAVEATRELMRVVDREAYKKDTVGVVRWPASDSEEDILKVWREAVGSTWHSCGTARMARTSTEGVVKNSFGVFGVKGLRVADLSVVPMVPR